MTISESNTPSPDVRRGLSSRGVTLGDSYNSGWETTGSGSAQVRSFPGFNSFVVDKPRELTGFTYGPQRSRDILILLGALGWLAVVALIFYGGRVSRRLVAMRGAPRPTGRRDPDQRLESPAGGAKSPGAGDVVTRSEQVPAPLIGRLRVHGVSHRPASVKGRRAGQPLSHG